MSLVHRLGDVPVCGLCVALMVMCRCEPVRAITGVCRSMWLCASCSTASIPCRVIAPNNHWCDVDVSGVSLAHRLGVPVVGVGLWFIGSVMFQCVGCVSLSW